MHKQGFFLLEQFRKYFVKEGFFSFTLIVMIHVWTASLEHDLGKLVFNRKKKVTNKKMSFPLQYQSHIVQSLETFKFLAIFFLIKSQCHKLHYILFMWESVKSVIIDNMSNSSKAELFILQVQCRRGTMKAGFLFESIIQKRHI